MSTRGLGPQDLIATTSAEDSNPEDKVSVSLLLWSLMNRWQAICQENRPDYLSTFVLFETWMPDFCEVTGRIKRSTTPGKGLKVLCLYTFKGKTALIKRLIKVLVVKN